MSERLKVVVTRDLGPDVMPLLANTTDLNVRSCFTARLGSVRRI